jgi:predicted small secreted protein
MIRAALPAAALAAALLLTGCSTTSTGIGAGTATALQQEVRHVADLAAAHRYPAALTAVAALRTDLGAAVDTGRVPESRVARIRAALALVEADLRRAGRTASPTPSATPTPTPTDTATPTTSATRTAAPGQKTPAPAPVPKVGKWHKGKGHKGRGG